MKVLAASVETVVWRYFLMMGVILASFLTGNFVIGLVLALPIFLSGILAVSFDRSDRDHGRSSSLNVPADHEVNQAA